MPYDPTRLEGRFLAGDPEAVAEVGRWVARVVASSSFWSLRSEWKDLHQETTGRLLESLRQGRFDPSQDFKTYTQAIARFTALKALGRQHRSPASPESGGEDLPDVAPQGRPEAGVIARQLARHVLERASDECRDLMRDFYLEDRSYAEIAAARGMPVGTVKSRLFRCLEAAHRLVAGRGPEKAP